MAAVIWVFVGGGLGSLLRYAISLWFPFSSGGFPLGTFLANFLACVLIGGMTEYLLQSGPNDILKWLFISGFCGGFSTFSTFSLEVLTLFRSGDYTQCLVYITASVLLCVLGILLGMKCAQWVGG